MSDISPLWISIKTAFTSTFIVFFLGITSAWFMFRYKGKLKGVLDAILTLPLAWPGIAAGTMLAFARALGELGATLMVAGSIQGKTQTIPIAIYFAVEGGENGVAIMWVLLIFIISLVVMVLTDKWSKKQYFIVSSGRMS